MLGEAARRQMKQNSRHTTAAVGECTRVVSLRILGWLAVLAAVIFLAVEGEAGGFHLSERLTDEEEKSERPHFSVPAYTKVFRRAPRKHFSFWKTRTRRTLTKQDIDLRMTEGACFLVQKSDVSTGDHPPGTEGESVAWECTTTRPATVPTVPVIVINQSDKTPFKSRIRYYFWKTPRYQMNSGPGTGELRIYAGPGVKATRRWASRAIEFHAAGSRFSLFIRLPLNRVTGGLVNPPNPPKINLSIPYSYGTHRETTGYLHVAADYCPKYPVPRYIFAKSDLLDGKGPFVVREDKRHPAYQSELRPTGLALVARPPWSRLNVRLEFLGRKEWPYMPGNVVAYFTGDEEVEAGESPTEVNMIYRQKKNGEVETVEVPLVGHISIFSSRAAMVLDRLRLS